MYFRILGPVEAVHGDHILDLGRPKQRAVLAALLLEPNRVVSFDRLVDQLWGDEPPPQAAASLQSYVSNLRRILEPDRGPRHRSGVLVTRSPGYMLVVDPERIDACQFEALVGEGCRMLEAGRPHEARRAFVDGLALWRGPALGALAPEPLFQPEAVRLEELRAVALEGRVDADLALGRHAELVADLEQLVAQWPLRERLWRQLMTALYRSGRHGEALRAYQACRRTMADELGIDPSPALRQLERDILGQAPSLDWRPPVARLAVVATPEPAEPAPEEHPRHGRVALVGRRAQLDALDAAISSPGRGGGRVVLLSGDAGIGKTRLLLEAADRAEAAGAEVAWGRCSEAQGAPAFWPWVEVLRRVLGPMPEDRRRSVLADHPPLAALLPEWGGTTLPSDAVGGARLPLFQSVAEVLTARRGENLLVLVLDDLHAADPASLALLEFLVERLGRSPVAVLCAFRDFEAQGDHPLADTLGAMSRHPWVERVRLPGLDQDAVCHFLAHASGTVPGPELTGAVWARTEGNPFFVGELVRLLEAEGVLARRDPGEVVRTGVPEGVRDVVRRRLRRLTPAAQSLLSVGSVVGRHFPLEVVEEVADMDADTALDAVELALVAGVVEEDGDSVGRYRFTHVLVRDTLYDDLSALRRARLHGRVAAAMEAGFGPACGPEDLAHHYWLARSVLEPAAVLPYLRTAAESAVSRYAWEQASELLRRSIELLAALAPSPDRDRQELDAQMLLGSIMANGRGPRHPDVHAAFSRAGELSARIGSGAHMVPVLSSNVMSYISRGQLASGAALAEEILEAGRRSSDPMFLAAGHLGLGMASYLAGRFPAADTHFAEGLALAPPEPAGCIVAGPPLLLYRCSRLIVLDILGNTDDASTLRAEIEAQVRASESVMERGMAAGHMAWLAALQGDVAAARRSAAEALETAGDGVFGPLEAVLHLIEGWCLSMDGRTGEGLATARTGLAELYTCGMRAGATFFEALTAEAEHRAGLHDEAVARVDAALADMERTGERIWESVLHRLRGQLLLASGCRTEATEALDRAVRVAEAQAARLFADQAGAALAGLLAA